VKRRIEVELCGMCSDGEPELRIIEVRGNSRRVMYRLREEDLARVVARAMEEPVFVAE
jgi:hypothetical protein